MAPRRDTSRRARRPATYTSVRCASRTAEVVSFDQMAEISIHTVSRPNADTVTISATLVSTSWRTSTAIAAAHRRAAALQPQAGGK